MASNQPDLPPSLSKPVAGREGERGSLKIRAAANDYFHYQLISIKYSHLRSRNQKI